MLLGLYKRVTDKTIRISKTLGIEGGKLLHPENDFDVLKSFNHRYEGVPTPAERMDLEYQKVLKDYPDLAASMPGRIFSGKRQPSLGARAVFFCFALPAADHGATPEEVGRVLHDSMELQAHLPEEYRRSPEKAGKDPAKK